MDEMNSDLDGRLPIAHLGTRRYPSPLRLSTTPDDLIADYTDDEHSVAIEMGPVNGPAIRLELAGPRDKVFFHGPETHAAIVTCGGLCPGLNNVIRDLVSTLWHRYGVRRISGFRYGYSGLVPETQNAPLALTPEKVEFIHYIGGSILGSSRGPQPPEKMATQLANLGIDILFCIGGDGTMRGVYALQKAIQERRQACAVVGVPKTIDNDLPYTERTFGFETAVTMATSAIRAAHVEASGAPVGLGLVKLMGRHAGFIAAAATVASREVDLVLVPEQPFDLDGENGVLDWLKTRLKAKAEAVVVVAEGAGQNHLPMTRDADASGNRRLGDIGTHLKARFQDELSPLGVSVKYIDPSYMIRATPATPSDARFCGRVAENAVHAGMAGKTGLMIGLWANRFVHVPLKAVIEGTKRVDLDGPLWRSVLDTTNQPVLFGHRSKGAKDSDVSPHS
ncbi:MAG: ATP-dependent 6-phosphofructokinase [Myxococcota bacterium]|nr:ATP-dependent 6-phosphofructokinase [Myxococcota bacterium]